MPDGRWFRLRLRHSIGSGQFYERKPDCCQLAAASNLPRISVNPRSTVANPVSTCVRRSEIREGDRPQVVRSPSVTDRVGHQGAVQTVLPVETSVAQPSICTDEDADVRNALV